MSLAAEGSAAVRVGGVGVTVRIAGLDAGPLTLAPPDYSQSPRLTIEQWESASAGAMSLAWGCVRGEASTWSQDATDVAQSKLAELASGTVARIRGDATPMLVVEARDEGRDRTLSADDGAASAKARTWVAFTHDEAHGCFVACVAPSCDGVLAEAKLTGDLGVAPSPGIALRSIAFVVHHPHGALATLGVALASVAVLAIMTRPGKRRRRAR